MVSDLDSAKGRCTDEQYSCGHLTAWRTRRHPYGAGIKSGSRSTTAIWWRLYQHSVSAYSDLVAQRTLGSRLVKGRSHPVPVARRQGVRHEAYGRLEVRSRTASLHRTDISFLQDSWAALVAHRLQAPAVIAPLADLAHDCALYWHSISLLRHGCSECSARSERAVGMCVAFSPVPHAEHAGNEMTQQRSWPLSEVDLSI